MADREVEVSVNAEGVDEAAGEMGGDAGGVPGGGVGGPDGGGGGGRVGGKLLTRLLGLLAFLGPILDVVQVVSSVLTAFVAPLAVLLLRLLQPTLRLLLRVLPIWFEIADILIRAAEIFSSIRSAMWDAIFSGVSRIGGWLMDLPGQIWSFMKRLPSMIGSFVAENIPDFPDFGNIGGGVGGGLLDALPGVGDDTGDGGGGDGPLVQIGGGLQPFVDRITQDGSFDFP